MSRSRNIKPGFFKNELLVRLPFEQRLLFIGLWTVADRAGRFEDRPTKIKMELFPADNVDVEAGLQALHDNGFILRYSCNGEKYCQVLAWAKHQNPHCKEVGSTIPAPCSQGASTIPAPEIPVRALLIPDSLIPDSLIPIPPSSSEGFDFELPRAREATSRYSQEDFNERDLRKMKEAQDKFDRKCQSGAHLPDWMRDEKQVFEWICREAGITVKRGLELEKLQKQWPDEQSLGASA